MTGQILAALKKLGSRLRPSRSGAVLFVELAGLAAIVYGIYTWNAGAAFIAAGVGLVLEAYVLERR